MHTYDRLLSDEFAKVKRRLKWLSVDLLQTGVKKKVSLGRFKFNCYTVNLTPLKMHQTSPVQKANDSHPARKVTSSAYAYPCTIRLRLLAAFSLGNAAVYLGLLVVTWVNEWMNERMNLFAWQKNNKISQAGTPWHDNCVHLPVSWATIRHTQLRVTIDKEVICCTVTSGWSCITKLNCHFSLNSMFKIRWHFYNTWFLKIKCVKHEMSFEVAENARVLLTYSVLTSVYRCICSNYMYAWWWLSVT